MLEKRLSEEKFLHSLGAEEAARELAKKFGDNPEKVAIAALLHDNAKCFEYEEMLDIIKENDFPIEKEIKNSPKILHAHVGAYLAEKELNIKKELKDDNNEIFNAIMFHTTGKENMSVTEKIVYLADKIESRTRPEEYRLKIVNKLDETNDLDKAVLLSIDLTLKSLIERRLPVNIQTVKFRNRLI